MRKATLTISLAGIVIGCFAVAALSRGQRTSVAMLRPTIVPESIGAGGLVVITQADDEAIRDILEKWRKHQDKVSMSSRTDPYFDCQAHRDLLEYGPKAAPYLIEQLARQRAAEAYLGAALIDDPKAKTLEQVYEYNRRRKTQMHDSTLAPWILTGALGELVIAPPTEIQSGGRRLKGFDWLDWWQRRKKKFVFPPDRRPVISVAHERRPWMSHISTTVKNGLLDICAVSATYRQMIERAAAEMGIETFIGEHRYMDIIGTVWMKSVTYEEFLYMVGRDVYILGFEYRKTENGYWVGGEKRAKPRAILSGWGIKMARTVFGAGEDIPVTIITRGMPEPADAHKAVFERCGSFRVTRNDGSVVKEYDSIEDSCSTAPTANRLGAMREVKLLLNQFCELGVGEYNIRFRYQGQQTPTMAIEVYPSGSKAARVLQARRPKDDNQQIHERGKK
ncbi:MAG: hypothetical protein ISS79_00500 [Phycisphaerae bacterium]|nr:hypothetical protein [Phycisphaerae bacterium]